MKNFWLVLTLAGIGLMVGTPYHARALVASAAPLLQLIAGCDSLGDTADAAGVRSVGDPREADVAMVLRSGEFESGCVVRVAQEKKRPKMEPRPAGGGVGRREIHRQGHVVSRYARTFMAPRAVQPAFVQMFVPRVGDIS